MEIGDGDWGWRLEDGGWRMEDGDGEWRVMVEEGVTGMKPGLV